MNREELDAELLKFLREQKNREGREDFGVRKLIGDIGNQVQLVSQKLDANHALTSERITGLSARIDKLEEDVEDTGVHNLQQIERARDEAIDEKKTWAKIAIAAVLAILSGGGTVELIHQISKGH